MDMLSYNIGTLNINGIANENKINALRSFIYLMDLDILMLQEVHEHISINAAQQYKLNLISTPHMYRKVLTPE